MKRFLASRKASSLGLVSLVLFSLFAVPTIAQAEDHEEWRLNIGPAVFFRPVDVDVQSSGHFGLRLDTLNPLPTESVAVTPGGIGYEQLSDGPPTFTSGGIGDLDSWVTMPGVQIDLAYRRPFDQDKPKDMWWHVIGGLNLSFGGVDDNFTIGRGMASAQRQVIDLSGATPSRYSDPQSAVMDIYGDTDLDLFWIEIFIGPGIEQRFEMNDGSSFNLAVSGGFSLSLVNAELGYSESVRTSINGGPSFGSASYGANDSDFSVLPGAFLQPSLTWRSKGGDIEAGIFGRLGYSATETLNAGPASAEYGGFSWGVGAGVTFRW